MRDTCPIRSGSVSFKTMTKPVRKAHRMDLKEQKESEVQVHKVFTMHTFAFVVDVADRQDEVKSYVKSV